MPAISSSWDRRSLLRSAAGLAAAGTLAACGGNNGRSGGGAGKGLVQYSHAYGEAGTEQAVKKYAAAHDKVKAAVRLPLPPAVAGAGDRTDRHQGLS
ncbi:hypothetical protein GCM10010129_27290 [Streptomyces fumigatiscleroticus]|nr:hypothetical protein GCM10010129_27290 [Streptomyces fumigatiscleroticus]